MLVFIVVFIATFAHEVNLGALRGALCHDFASVIQLARMIGALLVIPSELNFFWLQVSSATGLINCCIRRLMYFSHVLSSKNALPDVPCSLGAWLRHSDYVKVQQFRMVDALLVFSSEFIFPVLLKFRRVTDPSIFLTSAPGTQSIVTSAVAA